MDKNRRLAVYAVRHAATIAARCHDHGLSEIVLEAGQLTARKILEGRRRPQKLAGVRQSVRWEICDLLRVRQREGLRLVTLDKALGIPDEPGTEVTVFMTLALEAIRGMATPTQTAAWLRRAEGGAPLSGAERVALCRLRQAVRAAGVGL